MLMRYSISTMDARVWSLKMESVMELANVGAVESGVNGASTEAVEKLGTGVFRSASNLKSMVPASEEVNELGRLRRKSRDGGR